MKGAEDFLHRQVKYLNDRLERDHGKLKRPINPTRGFKSINPMFNRCA